MTSICYLSSNPIGFQLQVKGPADYSNFDNYPKAMDSPPDEISGWDDDF